ncbi:YqaJ viral recombinase family protein [Pararobbsia alpina]|uniref:YqaJ viral recombinase family nuclease n=1 Tax=Pararobbsia alpina TaxID=621374 RepID=UPI0039A5C489
MQTTSPRSRSRAALRLVETRELSRDDWLSVRRNGIGGSDAAAAVGISPYMSPLELWLIKTGRDAKLPKPDSEDTTDPVYWGTLLEPIVAAAYTKQTGRRLRRVNAVLQHPTIPFMLANLDREVTGNRDVQILECKTAGEFGARAWREGVPEYVQVQVQHQLAVTGKQAADVAVLICGQKLEVHRIERDDDLIARLIPLEAAFWRYVEMDTPPPADGSESSDRALRCLYPSGSGTVDFTGDRALCAAFADLVAVRADIEGREKVESRLKQQIQQAIGTAERAVFETGAVSFKRSRDGSGFDLARFQAEQPEVAARYAVPKPGTRRFLLST